jgi:hypothetical protein
VTSGPNDPTAQDDSSDDQSASTEVPAANPAYSTPPAEGLPDADND